MKTAGAPKRSQRAEAKVHLCLCVRTDMCVCARGYDVGLGLLFALCCVVCVRTHVHVCVYDIITENIA